MGVNYAYEYTRLTGIIKSMESENLLLRADVAHARRDAAQILEAVIRNGNQASALSDIAASLSMRLDMLRAYAKKQTATQSLEDPCTSS